jgi:hypothetical protein
MKKYPNSVSQRPSKKLPGNLSRRSFLSSCGFCAACAALAPLSLLPDPAPASAGAKKLKIKIIYSLHTPVQKQPDWPNTGFDFRPHMERFTSALQKKFSEFQFTALMATGPEDAEKIVQESTKDPADGYIVFQMNCWNQVVNRISETGKPVLYVDFQFGGSGGFLVYNAAFLRQNKPNVGFVASSDINDLLAAVSCFSKPGGAEGFGKTVGDLRRNKTPNHGKPALTNDIPELISSNDCISRLKQSRILAVQDQSARASTPIMLMPVEFITFAEVNEAWSSADKDEAKSVAERWLKSARNVIDVSFSTLETSAAMYLGMKNVLKKHDANAITINCLGGFYGGHIHAYPCLGFHELNNEGLVGGCECDINSAATMLAFSTLTSGRPGYISDPVIDTGKHQIIYAHCVASSKEFGPQGSSNPFDIMTHSEDRQGASVRSILPEGYMTTSMQLNQERKEILFHQAITVGNDPDDRACRTKLCGEPVGDIEKLFTTWDQWGWHRVTFYGDLKAPVKDLADSIGWKIVEEA